MPIFLLQTPQYPNHPRKVSVPMGAHDPTGGQVGVHTAYSRTNSFTQLAPNGDDGLVVLEERRVIDADIASRCAAATLRQSFTGNVPRELCPWPGRIVCFFPFPSGRCRNPLSTPSVCCVVAEQVGPVGNNDFGTGRTVM